MKRLIGVAPIALAVALTIGCSHANYMQADMQADAQAIQDLEKQWNQDFLTKDADKLAAYYSDDAVLMAPGMAPSVGRESIRAALKQMVADPGLTLKFTAARIEVAGSGDMGYSRGAYVMTMTDPRTKQMIHDAGSYVTTYRKEADGKWRAVADIASSETAPGQQASM